MAPRTTASLLLAAVVALGALGPAPADAAVRLFTAAGVPAGTPVRDDASRLRAWSATGAHLLARRDGRTVRVSRAGATLGRAPQLDRAYAIGPGERTVAAGGDPRQVELRAPDGRVTGTVAREDAWRDPAVAWSRDGARVALALGGEVVVADTASGAVLTRWQGEEPALPAQAFAPGGDAVVVVDGRRVVRLDVASGAATTVHAEADAAAALDAAWSPAGTLAVAAGATVRVVGVGDLAPGAEGFAGLGWSASGALAYAFARPLDTCSPPQQGVGLVPPGAAPRELVAPADREVRALAWSPDGATLAVDLGPVARPEPRRARRPAWPRAVARGFAMRTRAGDAALRRVVVRAARALRDGVRREPVLRQVRLDFARVADEHPEAWDSAVRDRLAAALDPWLAAAGFTPVGADDEITC